MQSSTTETDQQPEDTFRLDLKSAIFIFHSPNSESIWYYYIKLTKESNTLLIPHDDSPFCFYVSCLESVMSEYQLYDQQNYFHKWSIMAFPFKRNCSGFFSDIMNMEIKKADQRNIRQIQRRSPWMPQ